MNTLRRHIDTLSYQDLITLADNWEQFERDGKIGDCLLRETAEYFLADESGVVIFMERVAFEAYRAIAILHMDHDKGVEAYRRGDEFNPKATNAWRVGWIRESDK